MINIDKKTIIVLVTLGLLLNGCNQGGSSVAEQATVSTEVSTDDNNTHDESTENTEENSTTITEETTEVEYHKPVVEETKPSNWYIRLVAEDVNRGLKSASAQLGELEESDAVSKHTLKSLSPFGGSYLDVVFKDPAGVKEGEYKTNFHVYNESSEDRWQFMVKTDDANADISLTWRGLYVLTPYIDQQDRQRYKEYRSVTNPLIRQMKLVDSSNGNEIAAAVNGKVQTYSFNMDGQTERTFEWVVETEEVNISTPSSKVLTPQKKVLRSKTLRQKKSESFDLTQPPMIKEDMHGK
jgi:hypothetical protein